MEIKNTRAQLIVENADLSGSTFSNAKLAASAYRDCDLSESVYEDVNFASSKLSNINLTGVEIADCNLSGMTIDGVVIADALAEFQKSQPAVTAPAHPAPQESRGIRPFLESDEKQVIALWKSVFNYTAPHNDPATAIRQKVAIADNLFIVAVREGNIAGTAMGGYNGHRGWIYSLAVDPLHRRQGIATGLVNYLEQALTRRGCLKVNLQLLASNSETIAFYEKIGYGVEPRISMGKLLP